MKMKMETPEYIRSPSPTQAGNRGDFKSTWNDVSTSRNSPNPSVKAIDDDSLSTSSMSNSDDEVDTGETNLRVSSRPNRINSVVSDSKSLGKAGSPSKKGGKVPVQLIPDCPRAEDAAVATFERLETNTHQYKYLGKSKVQEDAMACECQFKPGDPLDRACGPHSDCINRLTQVECIDGECRCRNFCQNQRFQRRQYADVHIVKTDKKGFGLRAASAIKRDEFIYEYIGEVISEPTFYKRMRDYGEEGIEHFYFMMLQKDEFIDATKKGGIGRFANHSCNPNCYVARWVVGSRLRMGIFAKRDIQMHEELTFNYNVDRYGHDAQKCYCGEPNCVGYIGGKTQTDIGGMDDLYIEALGIAEEVARLNLKGSRKKKGKRLDEDFTPILKPMIESDVPNVVNAIRQTTNRSILLKLITRIKITEDPAVLRQVTRLRGLTIIHPSLEEYIDDVEVQTLILETIMTWPFVNRTKVEDSKIEPLLNKLTESEDTKIQTLSSQILAQWATLETVYRIPRKIKRDLDEDDSLPTIFEADQAEFESRPSKRARKEEPILNIKPLGVVRAGIHATAVTTSKKESPGSITSNTPTPVVPNLPSKGSLAQIIEQAMEDAKRAQKEQESRLKEQAAEEQRLREAKALRKQKAREKSEKLKRLKDKGKSKGDAEKQSSISGSDMRPKGQVATTSNKEKQLLKLVGAAVVGYLSQWRNQFESSEEFKMHAKEITQKIAEMEKKGRTYQSNAKLETLSDEKRTKIKSYIKSYVGRLPALQAAHRSRDPRRQHAINQETLSIGEEQGSMQADPYEGNTGQGTGSSDDDISDGSEAEGLEEDQTMENNFTDEQPNMEVDVF